MSIVCLNIKSVSEEKPVFLRLSLFPKSKSKTKEKSKILRLCFYRKVKRFFYNSSQKVLKRLLAQVHYDLCQRLARKADLAEVGPPGRMPLNQSFMLCAKHSRKSAPKAAVSSSAKAKKFQARPKSDLDEKKARQGWAWLEIQSEA